MPQLSEEEHKVYQAPRLQSPGSSYYPCSGGIRRPDLLARHGMPETGVPFGPAFAIIHLKQVGDASNASNVRNGHLAISVVHRVGLARGWADGLVHTMHHRCCRLPDSGGSEADWLKRCFAGGAAGLRAGWPMLPSGTPRWAGQFAQARSHPAGCSVPPQSAGRPQQSARAHATGLAARRLARIRCRRLGSSSRARILNLSPDGG